MNYSVFELLKEAHGHGRGCSHLWEEEKSFEEFLKQYNLISEYRLWEKKTNDGDAAKSLRKKGYPIRTIAKMLGYKNPGSITHLLSK